MSDRSPTPDDLRELIAELRAPVVVDPRSKRRVMEAVRREPGPVAAHLSPPASPPVRSRAVATVRRIRSGGAQRTASIGSLATAAGIAVVLAVGAEHPAGVAENGPRRAAVLGDTVVGALRDTLRLVQFMLTAPTASRVALAGDFNGWDPRSTQLARGPVDGRWTVTLALSPGRHSYAYVVDDTQWVRDPAGTAAEPNELTPPKSVVLVRE